MKKIENKCEMLKEHTQVQKRNFKDLQAAKDNLTLNELRCAMYILERYGNKVIVDDGNGDPNHPCGCRPIVVIDYVNNKELGRVSGVDFGLSMYDRGCVGRLDLYFEQLAIYLYGVENGNY